MFGISVRNFKICLLKCILFITFLNLPFCSGQQRRCFSCRSRTNLGDCRDPFYVTGNSSTLESKSHGVKTLPCASGWCQKILEDVDKVHTVDESYGGATQRDCLQRPPSDNTERCAFVKFNHKRVYMCFCRGDLCNTATSSLRTNHMKVPLFCVSMIFLVFKKILSLD